MAAGGSHGESSRPHSPAQAAVEGDEEAKAAQQVASVAQSSIRRLQMVVKEKEEIIVTLQNAVSAAYQAALQEQAHDQAQLEALHAVLFAHAERSIQDMHQALQVLARQKSDASGVTGTLTKSMARLIDEQLQDLTSHHEHEIEALNKSLDAYKNQCQELENRLAEERLQHQLHITKIAEEVRKQRPEEQQARRMETEKFQIQLKNKDAKLKEMREEMKLLELNLLRAQQNGVVKKSAREVKSSEYAKARAQASQLQAQVAALSQQLRQAKETTAQAHLADLVNSQEVKVMREEVEREREVAHRMAVQLAKYRQKEREMQAARMFDTPPLSSTKSASRLTDTPPPPDSNTPVKERDHVQSMPHIHALEWEEHGDDSARKNVAAGKELKETPEALARKVQTLSKKLRQYRHDLQESEESRMLCERMIEKLKDEAYRRRRSAENKHRAAERRKEHGPSADCVKIKELLESLEQVENDNTRLRKTIMVDQQSTIKKLEKEVKELKRLCFELGKDDADCDLHEYTLPPMDSAATTIPEREAESVQLKFEREQALWKLGQVQRRFNILFRAQLDQHSHKRHTCDYFIPPTIPPHAFAGRKLLVTEPNALTLMREFSNKGLKAGTSPREKELEGLVEALLRVVEKQRVEVEHLKKPCHDTIQHMERSKQLQRKVDELQAQLRSSKDDCCKPSHSPHEMIADLRDDVERLTRANTGLIHALKETEDTHAELQEKLHEATKDRFSARRRCSFNEDEQHEVSDLEMQAQEIARLQKELGAKLQMISDLKSQLESRDNELDFLHGQLAIKEAVEDSEFPKRVDLEQLLLGDTAGQQKEAGDDDVKFKRLDEDLASIRAENTRLKADLDAFDPESVNSLEDLRAANQELTKMCAQYEELLQRQAEQLGIPFKALRYIT